MDQTDERAPTTGSNTTNARGCGWALGLFYIFAVATIWIAASYVVQSVVDAGVSPFLITYICNSLFVVCLPLVEIYRCLGDSLGRKFASWGPSRDAAEHASLLQRQGGDDGSSDEGPSLDAMGRWTRSRVAKVSLLICPFWYLGQLTFNLSLKYTTVTSNTILSSASSLFTFLVAMAFLGEKFACTKLISVLLCMGGSIVVSLTDSATGGEEIAISPLLGDILALVSAGLYAIFITLIRLKLPDKKGRHGQASMAQFFGFLGLFNFLIFLPFMLVLNFTGVEPIHMPSWKQFGLIIGKGLFDNVLSDYLWAEAALLTTTTVATAGLTIQVPMAALVDSLMGHAPHVLDYVGAGVIMVGFVGLNVDTGDCCGPSSAVKTNEVVDTAHGIDV